MLANSEIESKDSIKALLKKSATIPKARHTAFFKTGDSGYANHDRFIGVPVPALRNIAKKFKTLPFKDLQFLIESPFNEERLLALLILAAQYKNAESSVKDQIYEFYMANLQHVNNWNLVDSSAHLILGSHLLREGNREILIKLAKSDVLWERRIAIVSTLQFIRNNDLQWTFKIAKILMRDKHDLIHKATGWMLREAGKKDKAMLVEFLDKYSNLLPRTMLRYAIEKFPKAEREKYLVYKRSA